MSRIAMDSSPAKSPRVKIDSILVSETDTVSGYPADISVTLNGESVSGWWEVVSNTSSRGQVVLGLKRRDK